MTPRKKLDRDALGRPARASAVAGPAILTLVFLLLFAGRASAATQVWDGGCGADHSWSCAGNWKSDVAPVPADTVTFNAKSTGTSVVDPGFGGAVTTLNLAAGYSGTVLLERSLTVAKNFQQVSGQFTAGANALTTQTFLLSGGTFEASSATTTVGGTMKISGTPKFDPDGGDVVFTGTGGTLTCGGVAFNRVVFANTAGTKTVTSSCNLPLGADPVAGAGGSIKLEGALSGSGSLSTTGTLTLGPLGSLSGFSALDADSLTVSGPYDFGAYSSLSVSGTFTVNASGDFVAPASTASFAGRFRVLATSTFDANGGEIVFDGAANSAVACGNKSFALVSFEQTSGVKSVEGDCSLPLGANPTLGHGSEASVKLSGTLSGAGTIATGGNLTMNRTAQLTGFGGLDVDGNLTVTSATANFGSYAPFSVDGNYSQAAGKVTFPSGAEVDGVFALNPRAVFEAPAGSVSVGGDFSVNPEATFRANGGTVVLDGGNQSVSGSTTFNNLTKVGGSSDTLSFATGQTQTVQGLLKLRGKDGSSLLKLAPTSSGSPWKIDRAGTAEVEFVSVAESTNVGTPIVAPESFNEGGNTGWSISGPAAELILKAQTTTPTAGSADNLTITAKDAYGNTSASYTGTHNLTFGPVADSPSGAHATVTDSSGTAVNFGAATPIGFNEGVATVSGAKNGAMTLVKAGSTSITVSDGSISNGSGLAVTVSPAIATSFALEAQTTTPTAGSADNLTITAKDAYGNTSASYTGTHSLTFGPVADSPSGAHATVADSSGTAVKLGTATLIGFNEGVATVSGAKNGAMTLVKAGSTSITVSDGSISNGSGLAVTVGSGTATNLALAAQTTTPLAGETDNLTITAKDAYGNISASYTGTHNLTFGPAADSPSGAQAAVANFAGGTNPFGTSTQIGFTNGVATASGAKNGVMTLVKAGATSITVSDGSISNGSGLAVTVSPGAAARIGWTHATLSKGVLSSLCLFTCSGTEMSSTGILKANVSVTDGSGNTVSNLGSGHTVSVTAASGTITGGTLTIAASGAAESTTQFTYTSNKGGSVALTAATAGGTVYTSATATMMR
jgi:hypothetical protein